MVGKFRSELERNICIRKIDLIHLPDAIHPEVGIGHTANIYRITQNRNTVIAGKSKEGKVVGNCSVVIFIGCGYFCTDRYGQNFAWIDGSRLLLVQRRHVVARDTKNIPLVAVAVVFPHFCGAIAGEIRLVGNF